ncbi:MAG: YHYH protein [Gemmatimonadota bacterium]
MTRRARLAGAALLPVLGIATVTCASVTDIESNGEPLTELPAAFADFNSDNVTVAIDGANVVIESNGYPDHESPYWSPGHALHVSASNSGQLAPGYIDDFNGSYSLTVPGRPEVASNPSATGLGPIGIARSGAMIYNDQEGPNVPLDNAIGSFDFTGAHTGPQSYHYHLEPVAWSFDDDELIGIMSDGFFLYGRREPDGTHPSDLDESGGHFGPTPHNPDGEYHYHVKNELYLGAYYILFPGDYQGSPNAIR